MMIGRPTRTLAIGVAAAMIGVIAGGGLVLRAQQSVAWKKARLVYGQFAWNLAMAYADLGGYPGNVPPRRITPARAQNAAMAVAAASASLEAFARDTAQQSYDLPSGAWSMAPEIANFYAYVGQALIGQNEVYNYPHETITVTRSQARHLLIQASDVLLPEVNHVETLSAPTIGSALRRLYGFIPRDIRQAKPSTGILQASQITDS